MRIKPFLMLLAVLFSSGVFLSCQQTAPLKTIRIGYMICNSEQETLERFRPLTEYLGKKLGVKAEAVAIDTVDFTRKVEGLDFTHTNSLLYIILNRFHGVRPMAADEQGSLKHRSKGAIVTNRKSGINELKDIKGRSMVFGPMLAPTGYLQQYDLMLKAGIDPEEDLSFYTIPTGSFKHEKVIYSVLYGKYDVGAFPMLDFEKMIEQGKINPEDFKILAESEPIPYCTFGATQRVDDSLLKKFRNALVELKEDDTVEIDGQVVKVLDRAMLDGFKEVKDEDYNLIRDIARRTNMPPYQKY